MRISDWSSDVCSSDLTGAGGRIRSQDSDIPVPPPFPEWCRPPKPRQRHEQIRPHHPEDTDRTRPPLGRGARPRPVRERPLQIGSASCREECVSTCRSRWSPYHQKKKTRTTTQTTHTRTN